MAGIAESRNEPVSGFRAGDMAVMEYEVTAVDAASGQEFTFRGALIAELEGNLIRHSREYFDVATILGQLGMLDMGEATQVIQHSANSFWIIECLKQPQCGFVACRGLSIVALFVRKHSRTVERFRPECQTRWAHVAASVRNYRARAGACAAQGCQQES